MNCSPRMATASAPAQEVFVYDTLDLTKYIKEQFSFGNVGFGDTILYPIQNGYEFSLNVDLRPTKNLITRISGVFDTITGIISWSFVSLDPLIMDLTEDPMGGFLPPNINYPEGVGFVSFNIGVNENLTHGTIIDNQATIIFDLNPQILTNIWSNEIDLDPPSSALNPLESTIYDTTFLVSWYGNDNESGLLNYSIFVSKNSGPVYEWISKTNKTEAWFVGEYGNSYSFFTQAIDSVGNIEQIYSIPDETVWLEPSGIILYEPIHLAKVYPNPCQKYITVDVTLNFAETLTIEVYNSIGNQIFKNIYSDLSEGEHLLKINTDTYSNGVYTLKVKGENYQKVFKIVKVD